MWKLINYFDVWGNKKDGWEVNNLCQEGEPFELSLDCTQKDVLAKIKEVGFFKPSVRMNMISFSVWDQYMIEIEQKSTGKPICRLEYIEEPTIEDTPTEPTTGESTGEEETGMTISLIPSKEELTEYKEQLAHSLDALYTERNELKETYYADKQEARNKAYSKQYINDLRTTYYAAKDALYDRIRAAKDAIDAANMSYDALYSTEEVLT